MAWQNAAKTMDMLASLANTLGGGDGWQVAAGKKKSGGGGKGALKGDGKGSDKGKGKGGSTQCRQCLWDDCKAAEKHQATWGGVPNCHCCSRPHSKTPPLERMVEWAYLAKLKDQQAKPQDKGKGKGGKGGKNAAGATAQAGKGSAVAAPAATPPDQLALLRTQRQAELKTAKDKAQAPTPLQLVAKTFNSTVVAGTKTYEVDAELALETEQLGSLAAKVLVSLKAEAWPATNATPLAEKVVEELVGKLEPFARDQGRQQAEMGLTSTKASITALQTGHCPDDDEVMVLLQARKLRQETALEKLEKKTPSAARRRNALVTARQDFVDAQSERADVVARGTSNSIERACERAATLLQLEETVQRLKEAADSAVAELTLQRDVRESNWRGHAQAVVDLIDKKITELDTADIFLDADEEEPVLTSTEQERNESVTVAAKMKQQIAQLQEAVRLAEEVAAQPAAAPAAGQPNTQPATGSDPADLWLTFQADVQLLPQLVPADEEGKTTVGDMATFFAAVPWGTQLPAVTFEQLGALPSCIHTMVGDTMWEGCWQARHGGVTSSHFVPYQLLNLVKWAVEKLQPQHTSEQEQEGRDRYNAVAHAAEQRRKHGSPY